MNMNSILFQDLTIPHVELKLSILHFENVVVLCKEIVLQKVEESPSLSDNYYSAVIGLPSEASNEELLALFEPIRTEVEDLIFLEEHIDVELCQLDNKPYTIHQRKIFCIARFASETQRKLFNALYHNMPVNNYRDCPPCVVTNVSSIIVGVAENASLQMIDLMNDRLKLNHQSSIMKSEKGDPSNVFASSIVIPTCPLCIRRLKTMKQILALHTNYSASTQEIAVGRSFHNSSLIQETIPTASSEPVKHVRCIVCFTYDFYQSKDHKKSPADHLLLSLQKSPINNSCAIRNYLGSCFECHLLENIWSCLICGYTGCGRYTKQHAEKHSVDSHHQYSLELATGRIWEYCNDRFVHYEDSSSVYNGLLQQFTNLSFDQFEHSVPLVSESLASEDISTSKLLVSEQCLQNQETQLFQSLGMDKTEKISNLTSEYERMIELQLQDQQLYYEKLLARETVRAMEYSFNLQRGNTSVHNTVSKLQSNNFNGNYEDFASKQMSNHQDLLLDQELEEIEKLKLEISSIELEYKIMLEEKKEAEDKLRQQKKVNDQILKEQKVLKLQEAEIVAECEALNKTFKDEMEDLNQQITDLTFYMKTKKKMDASPYKDEIANGIIITGESSQPKKSSRGNVKKR